jgi:hypothetical protein
LERDLAHERQLGDSMVIFADRAIPESSPLSHWYTLGRALGEFRQRAQRETADALAPLRSVAEAARGVGQEHLGRVPELNELAGLVNRPEGETEPGLRQAFVARIGLDGPFDDLAPWPASPFLAEKVWRIALQVTAHLQNLPAVQDFPPPPDVPRWHAAEGKLYYRGKLVREVARQAKNVRLILDALQAKGWPEWVDTHLTEDTRKEAVESFNRKCCVIELYRAHTATAIGWRERPLAGDRKTPFRKGSSRTGS